MAEEWRFLLVFPALLSRDTGLPRNLAPEWQLLT